MIGQDLNPGANDEHHEEHVEKVLELQPPRKSGIDRGSSLRDAGVLFDEVLDSGEFAQTLRKSDQENQRGCANGYCPEKIDPALADPYVRNNSITRREPMRKHDPVVRRTQSGCHRIVGRRFDVDRVSHRLRFPDVFAVSAVC